MLPKVSERRRVKQKSQRHPTFRVENEFHPETITQRFQIAVNILNAKKLVWANQRTANSYVIVRLGKKRRRTAIRRNMEEPYYKEYFVFETLASVRDIQQLSLNLSIMELRRCYPSRLLGEANIEMDTIWNQPYHQVFRKWIQLSQPRDPLTGPVGFLEVDISITFRGEVQYIPPILQEDDIEDNLLLPSGLEQNRANYIVTIFKGYSLPNGIHCYGDQKYGKLPNTFIKVTFCGLVAKTSVQHKTNYPNFNEQLSFVEMFPNLCQIINIEVLAVEGCFNRILCGTQLKLNQISHEGENGFLPTFGPSLIHMHGSTCSSAHHRVEDGPFYKGSLLLSANVVVPYHQQGIRSVGVEPIIPIPQENLWSVENFCIYCPLFEVSMLDNLVSGSSCGIALSMGNILQVKRTDEEFFKVMAAINSKKLYYTGSTRVTRTTVAYGHLDFLNAFPILQLASRLPDFRFSMFGNNMVKGIILDLESTVEITERRLKTFEYETISDLSDALNMAIDEAASSIIKYLNVVDNETINSSTRKYETELDRKITSFQKNEIQKVHFRMKAKLQTKHSNSNSDAHINLPKGIVNRKQIKIKLAEVREIVKNLQSLIFETSDGWPDIVLWLLSSGSRVAYTKISAADVIYSTIPEQCGKLCGRIQTHYMKPLKCPKHLNTITGGCHCLAAKLELTLWMGLFDQKSAFVDSLPKGYVLKTRDEEMCLITKSTILEARCFIYRAKLNSGIETTGLADTFVRINVFNAVKDSQVKLNSLTPVYNQVLRIQKSVLIPQDRLLTCPPTVLIEVYNRQYCGRPDIFGRLQIQPTIDKRIDYEYAPKLQWCQLYRGMEFVGQLLMSLQIVIMPETELQSEKTTPRLSPNLNILKKTEVEPLPINLIPKLTTYKLDVYWWGLRDIGSARKPCVLLEIDDVTIKSNIILDKKPNSNFPNGRITHTFEAPLNEIYCPPLSINLYDTTTFGRTVFLGTNIVKNPKKYMVNWLHQTEREAFVNNSPPFISKQYSKDVIQVYRKESEEYPDEEYDDEWQPKWGNNKFQIYSLFRKTKVISEEKYKLLPTVKKENIYGIKSKKELLAKDWWLRFFCSQKECSGTDELDPLDKIMIYTSELECQPGFSKFKDWCIALKLYKGKKTGIPEKDERLYSGLLKAGIAIYKWPPPPNTIAVSASGVDLNKGFFDEHPNNNPSKYLVRVYIVKGFNLMAKDYLGKSDPYVIINCGRKTIGDRKSYIPNTLNPIFGRMYEFKATMPDDYLLSISVYDYDLIPPDEIIGCTAIDLEDRIYTKHRATCGLASVYTQSGINKWRDCMKPSVILEELCAKNHIPSPLFTNTNTVMVNGLQYSNKIHENTATESTPKERKENICLKLLHEWYTIPICGHNLVPEHVETRTLYNPDKPGMDQGKLQLWVDIFPLDTGYSIPPAVDITPRKVEEYELRVIIWDVDGIKLDDYDILTGQRSSDIYVKAWIGRIEESQSTDIHYRSFTGVGNFNWRMIFKIFYQHAERKIIVKQNKIFTQNEDHFPPILNVQVMDSDAISADDFLGSLRLNLNAMPRGARSPRFAKSKNFSNIKKINLFNVQSLRGWWPLSSLDPVTKKELPAGVIDIELSLFPIERAAAAPVGLGREGPQPLPLPKRPDTSFNPFLNPLRLLQSTFAGRWKTISAAICFILILILLLSAYIALPRVLMERWLGRRY